MSTTPIFTLEQLQALTADPEAGAYVTGEVTVSLDDLISWDHAAVLDELSELLIGSELLMDTDFDPVSLTDDGWLVLRVTGDVSRHLEIYVGLTKLADTTQAEIDAWAKKATEND